MGEEGPGWGQEMQRGESKESEGTDLHVDIKCRRGIEKNAGT